MSSTPHGSPSPPDPAPSKSNRRQFLMGAAGGAALVRPVAEMAWGAQSPASPGANWDQLGRTLKGNLLRPGDAGYDDVIKIRNLRYAGTHPAGVALVADAQDVATAIAWARDNHVEMVSRSGGHSYAGYSTTPGLVINLKAMTSVTVDQSNGKMTVRGAATNQDVANAGKPAGLAIPGGQCPAVGIAGFVLGGGLGFYMREHGLGIDSLLATEIVTADGAVRRVTVDELKKKDLFWALCGGGGGNFGINTSFIFRTFAVPKQVMTFSLRWDAEDSIRGFLLFQEILRDAPRSLGAIAHFGTVWDQPSGPARTSLRIFGQVGEGKKAAHKLLEPLSGTSPREMLIDEKDFWAAKDWLAGTPSAPNAFTERSRFHTKPLPEAAVGTLVEAFVQAPIHGPGQSVESPFFAWGGAVATRAPDFTAFVHRKDFWLQSFNCSWTTKQAMDRLITWQDKLYSAMGAYSSDRSYQNFTDPELEHPLQAYYAENLPRLIEVKTQYDPKNVFDFPQSIRG
jgi:FAD/FMN-containing dehydrogenase